MIPILGLTTPATAGSGAPGTPAEGVQGTEKSTVFGAILNSESAPQTATAVPPVVEVESGNLLPGGGNLLPVLTPQDIASAGIGPDSGLASPGVSPGSPGDALAADGVLPGLASPAQASLLGAGPVDGDAPSPVLPPLTGFATGATARTDAPAASAVNSAAPAADAPGSRPPAAAALAPSIALSGDVVDTDAYATRTTQGLATLPADTGTALAQPAVGQLTETAVKAAPRSGLLDANTDNVTRGVQVAETSRAAGAVDSLRLTATSLTVADEVAVEPLQTWGTEFGSTRNAGSPSTAQPLVGFVTPGGTDSLQSARAPALVPLTVPPGEPEFTGELASRVSLMVKNGTQEASLQLNPPELGRVEIRIVTEGDQARVQFAVHNPDARDAIEQHLPRLREMLEQGGLQLARSDVGDQFQRERDAGATPGELSTAAEEETTSTEVPVEQVVAEGVLQAGVDYYV